MATYPRDFIRATSGIVVHLRFVESVVYKRRLAEQEEQVVDILKGNTILIMRSISGVDHEICIENILSEEEDTESTPQEMANAICARWVKLNSNMEI